MIALIVDTQVFGISWILRSANIIFNEIKKTLKRGERIELRGFGVFSTKIQKSRISRNPKTGEKVNTPEKKNNSLQNVKRFV